MRFVLQFGASGLVALLLCAFGSTAVAQNGPNGPPARSPFAGRAGRGPGPGFDRPEPVPPHLMMERISRMSPDELERMLRRFPPERRANFEERLKHLQNMPPALRERMREEFNAFMALKPEQREEVRQSFAKLSRLPDDRRMEVRREVNRLRQMPPQRRTARMSNPRFKEEFSEEERQILADLSALPVPTMPPPPPPGGRRPDGPPPTQSVIN